MEKVWILTSQWTIEDDGNADEQLHGVFGNDDMGKHWYSLQPQPSRHDSSRTYWLMQWKIDDPEYQGQFFWTLDDRKGMEWVKVHIRST